jgi:hypothetical protein
MRIGILAIGSGPPPAVKLDWASAAPAPTANAATMAIGCVFILILRSRFVRTEI